METELIDFFKMQIEAIIESYNDEIKVSIDKKNIPYIMKRQLKIQGDIVIESNNELKNRLLKIFK